MNGMMSSAHRRTQKICPGPNSNTTSIMSGIAMMKMLAASTAPDAEEIAEIVIAVTDFPSLCEGIAIDERRSVACRPRRVD